MTSAERDAELLRLQCLDLDLYLEQRLLYRQLVAMGSHAYKGVPVPEKPRSLSNHQRREKAHAASESRPTRERIVRTFRASLVERTDGRTIEARVVPYNEPTTVVDLPVHGGSGIPYLERWMPGAFEKQARAANRVEVYLNFEHEPGLRGIVGHGVKLREQSDALYGTFRVHPGSDGDKALHMVNEGILTGLSIEAIPLMTKRSEDGIVNRMKARLDKVALCRGELAAYPGAEVLAVRNGA